MAKCTTSKRWCALLDVLRQEALTSDVHIKHAAAILKKNKTLVVAANRKVDDVLMDRKTGRATRRHRVYKRPHGSTCLTAEGVKCGGKRAEWLHTVHAEMAALQQLLADRYYSEDGQRRRMSRRKQRFSMVVVRFNTDGLLVNSKPCASCISELQSSNLFAKIFYSVDSGEINVTALDAGNILDLILDGTDVGVSEVHVAGMGYLRCSKPEQLSNSYRPAHVFHILYSGGVLSGVLSQ